MTKSETILAKVRRHAQLQTQLWRGGISEPYRFHYFGEFGYFNMAVLGGLQSIFRQRPRLQLEILTFPAFGDVLSELFPNNVCCRTMEYDFPEELRSEHLTRDEALLRQVHHLGFRNSLHDVFKTLPADGALPRNVGGFYFLQEPLRSAIKLEAQCYVSIFPRARKHLPEKNLSVDAWQRIIDVITSIVPYPIVVHGLTSETLALPQNPRFVFPRNVLEQIAYFNRSQCFISLDSGLGHFGLNCKCDCLIIGGTEMFYQFVDFNPFNNRLELTSLDPDKYLPRVHDFLLASDSPAA